jgi:hypothetical protein
MGDDVTVKKLVIYAMDKNNSPMYIHCNPQGDFVLNSKLSGAEMFTPPQAEKFIAAGAKTFPGKLYTQAVR